MNQPDPHPNREDCNFVDPRFIRLGESDSRTSHLRRSKLSRVDLSSLSRAFGLETSKPPQTIEDFQKSIADNVPAPTLSDESGMVTTRQRASSWCFSLIVHALLVLLLAFIFFPKKPNLVDIEAVFSANLGDQLDFLTDDQGSLNPNEAANYALTVPEELKIEDEIVFEKKELPFESNAAAPIFEQSRIEMNEMLSGRTDPGLKNDLLSKYGGNKTTEDSVEFALTWLRKQQLKDGAWSLQGPYAGGIAKSTVDNKPAATGLALLAFQGAGNTRSRGPHSLIVKRGWTWLLKQQNSDGSFIPQEHSKESLFYTQAICTIALCELLTLEKNNTPNLRKQAEAAVNFLLENQHKTYGGWKYSPQESSDLSVTGWCLMALKTAEMAGIKIPQTNFDRISEFLNSISYDNGAGYAYQLVKGKVSDLEKRPSMTATGLLCREYLGWAQNDPALLKGAESLASPENLVRFPSLNEEKATVHNVYGWYSTSMALKGLGPYNKYWRRWNAALSKELPKNQEPSHSPEAGSWDPKYDEYNFGGGRLYVTCLSVLCLEVYYRHLSIYR